MLFRSEGFVESRPRGFAGDFTAITFGHDWWNGRGIVYGPVFVVESWFVAWWPRLFTPEFFAVANAFLAGGAFVFGAKACRADRWVILASLAAWLCYWRLFYAFSVAANPEFLELFLLSWAWFAASRGRERTEGAMVAMAGLTKLVPWVFLVPLALRRSVRALTGVLMAAVPIVLVVAIGQKMSPAETLLRLVLPTNGRPLPTGPTASSGQFQGVGEALARLVYGAGEHALTPGQSQSVLILFAGIVLAALGLAVWASIRLLRRGASVEPGWTFVYPLYFALLPVLSVQAHPHTFLFLLPVWIALLDQLSKDQGDARLRAVFGACFA